MSRAITAEFCPVCGERFPYRLTQRCHVAKRIAYRCRGCCVGFLVVVDELPLQPDGARARRGRNGGSCQ
jgi:hypothetical protein